LKSIRAFIAIDLDPGVRRELERTRAALQEAIHGDPVRWVNLEQAHLTLQFLGNLPPSAVEPLTESLGDVGRAHGPFRLRAEGVGAFPDLRRPRVIWAGLTGELPALEVLQRAVAATSAPYLEKEETRSFSPHLTLGRVREEAWRQAGAIGEAVSHLPPTVFGEWQVTRVRLMRSELSPSGARHTVLAELPLALARIG
jgi:2'-5' RNA ligase